MSKLSDEQKQFKIYNSHNEKQIIEYLIFHKLLNESVVYDKCGRMMALVNTHRTVDDYEWKCKTCSTSRSVRNGSFFQLCRIPFHFMRIIFYPFT